MQNAECRMNDCRGSYSGLSFRTPHSAFVILHSALPLTPATLTLPPAVATTRSMPAPQPPASPGDEPKPSCNPALAPLRTQIDDLDRRIVELLNDRARIVVEIGKIKQQNNAPIYAPDR